SLRFAASIPNDYGLRLAGALFPFWNIRGYYKEGREWLRSILDLEWAQARTRTRAKALNCAGGLADNEGDSASARSLHEESLAIRREIEDRPGIANSLNNLGHVIYTQGDCASARPLIEESLAIRRELEDRPGIANSLSNLGLVAYAQGDYAS